MNIRPLVALLCVLSLNAVAANNINQDCPHGDGGVPPELATNLHLSKEQTNKLTAAMKKHRERMDAEREAMRKLHESQRQDIAAILNAEQMKTFDAWAHSHRPPHRPDDAPSGNNATPDMRPAPDQAAQ